ncbi:E3 ubiquitin-protein ligase SDIR1 [Marchantia polymorpha subsp. ruderalis]|uniref:RING-type E3 ubiquitin transferase n=2 Tax=Marchantia polymorpha TaxID=3197 RepID=A0AAF6BCS8_MARPO|nr:hypothetical protein MARPO_0020s0054 [Marchantia polymorpha]PTQ44387.1 hypothetical protein MARPO_0020s0054 [Marchantia polymorpha]BBN09811.1 hypothetical protein Mp_4g22920 [Marchantia polymorpha subsp. ruderalis]BBN09812.1 hypothetical protein Mp_4g22920 [Marchantia polymorpha subsp. ruderalis]|eukprot:PTQ44386.1 hypothetical protein MARPO_0020s0054 [Marchantia polymorpha]
MRMSFVFRGSRGDLENGFHNFTPERRAVVQRFHGNARSNANPLTFLFTVLLLFVFINSHQMSPNFLLWLGMGVFLMATGLRMYAMCQQLQAQAQAVGALVGHTELHLRMPPSLTIATRGRLQGLRLQLALLDRDFDDLDYEALRALDGDNPPGVASLSEAEIGRLPVHKYKGQPHQISEGAPSPSQASSAIAAETGTKKSESGALEATKQKYDEELTCTVCLEQVVDGELVRSLPCLHQFHAGCIDQWLRQQATCPVCKFRLTSSWPDGSSANDGTFMV